MMNTGKASFYFHPTTTGAENERKDYPEGKNKLRSRGYGQPYWPG
jgi:hypothetical protein